MLQIRENEYKVTVIPAMCHPFGCPFADGEVSRPNTIAFENLQVVPTIELGPVHDVNLESAIEHQVATYNIEPANYIRMAKPELIIALVARGDELDKCYAKLKRNDEQKIEFKQKLSRAMVKIQTLEERLAKRNADGDLQIAQDG